MKMNPRVVGVEPYRLPLRSGGGRQVAGGVQRDAEIVVDHRVFRSQGHGGRQVA